jgi:spore coat polysaccharide biosynthesis protein SpsF
VLLGLLSRTKSVPMIVAVLQARMSSSRLAGKVMRPILGVPMLARQLERVKRAHNIDCLMVATSSETPDSEIAALCEATSTLCYRGSFDDVLDRCYRAVKPFQPDYVVRLTGDCPLADWSVIDRAISFCCEGGFDYASNTLRPSWPDGLDVEVARFSAFEQAWHEAVLPSEREHVTPFLYRRPERFRLGSMVQEANLSGLRWTVDEPEDFAFVTKVYEALYGDNPAFTTEDILALLQACPDLQRVNEKISRNEGLKKSVAEDAAYLASRRE